MEKSTVHSLESKSKNTVNVLGITIKIVLTLWISWVFEIPRVPRQHFEDCCYIVFHYSSIFKLFVQVLNEWLHYILGTELENYLLIAQPSKIMCWISAKGFLSSSFSYLSLTSSLTLQCGNLNLSQPIKASDNPVSLCTFRDSSSCSILGPVTCNWRTHKHKFNLVRFYTAPEYHLPQGSDHNPPLKKKLFWSSMDEILFHLIY